MSKANALAGLIGNYGDSDEDSDDGGSKTVTGLSRNLNMHSVQGVVNADCIANSQGSHTAAAIHPAPIPHCRE